MPNTEATPVNITTELYDQAFYAWALKNAELLRRGQMADIELEQVEEKEVSE
jgi:hypothetical protein